jgi:hypothetical protein
MIKRLSGRRVLVGSLVVLALSGGGAAAAAATGGGSATAATAGGPASVYVPQLGLSVPASKLAAVQHELGHACYPAQCQARRSVVRTQIKPAGPIAAIPARRLPANTPIPFPPSQIKVSNDWLTSNGVTLVAVYAGTSGVDPASGRFMIVRQNEVKGTQSVVTIDVRGAGALTLVGTPAGSKVELSAQQGVLHFTTSKGLTGALNLRTDQVTISQ